MSEPLVLMVGKDPLEPGGHESYVQAHGVAATQLGFEPHLFYLGGRQLVQQTDFGVLHRIASPPRPTPPAVFHVPLLAQIPWLAHAAAGFLARTGGPRLIHGFGVFAAAGAATQSLLARRGLTSIALASAYATRAYEINVMKDGLASHHGRFDRLRYWAYRRWVVGVDDPIEGWGYRRSSLVLVNYDSVWRLLSSSYGPRINLRQIPYCSLAAFESPDARIRVPVPDEVSRLRPADAPLLVCISRQDPRKGVDRLLLALDQLRRAGVAFRACLVGPGRLLEAHRRLAAELGLDGQVALPGAVADPARHLSAADVFVLPSLGESSGSVSVLEALQQGKPIVASACDGIPEDLTHDRDALLVTPGDPAAMASAIRRLLDSPELRARLAAGARATYEARFTSRGFVTALGGVYDELASGAPAPVRHERIVSAT